MAADKGWAAAARKDAAPPVAPMPATVPRARSSDGVQTVVVDANALIRGISLSGLKFELCTIKEVVNEVRDPRSRAQLQALPVELAILEPSPESLAKVVEFARATGDIHSLSGNDLKVLALAHTLEVQAHGGDSHLRARPPPLVRRVTKKNQEPDPPGWGSNVPNLEEWEELDKADDQQDQRDESHVLPLKNLSLDDTQRPFPTALSSMDRGEDDIEECKDSSSDQESDGEGTEVSQEEARLVQVQHQEHSVGENVSGELEEDDDGEEAKTTEEPGEETPSVTDASESEKSWGLIQPLSMSSIACMTTDFAMQNVILQMGLRLLTPNGVQVRELQRWVLRCHACFTVTREMSRVFCPKCGNGGTLSRVSESIGANGTVIGTSKRRINIRGTRYSLPLPKGGREAVVRDPILREDQLPQRFLHPKKSSKSSKAADDDLDLITSFDDILRPKAKQSFQSPATSMRTLASQFSGRRNPNDSHYAKQRRR